MPYADLPRSRIYYEEAGSGYPLLALAPGGLESQMHYWGERKDGSPRNFPNPIPELAKHFRVITLDQRNAGRSTGTITADDGWHTYAADHLALMDHLGISRFHVIGACIGGPFGFKLCETAPERITAFVSQATIGFFNENRHLSYESFGTWLKGLLQRQPDVDLAALHAMKERMYTGDFVYGISREFIQASRTPLLVLAGADNQHPRAVSEEIARLSPVAEFIGDWQGEGRGVFYLDTVRDFLARHTP